MDRWYPTRTGIIHLYTTRIYSICFFVIQYPVDIVIDLGDVQIGFNQPDQVIHDVEPPKDPKVAVETIVILQDEGSKRQRKKYTHRFFADKALFKFHFLLSSGS